jgi:hypothetical protein
LLQTLSSSPHLARYVRSLNISDVKSYDKEPSWIDSDDAVHKIVTLLADLEALSLGCTTGGIHLNFLEWGHDLRRAISKRCSSERLVAIHLAHLRCVPLRLLGLAPQLEELRLTGVFFAPELDRSIFHLAYTSQDDVKLKERLPRARLKHLSLTSTISGEWRTFYYLLDHVQLDLTHLKALKIHVNFSNREDVSAEDLQAISNILRGCSSTVETLSLLVPREGGFTICSFLFTFIFRTHI